MIRLPLSLIVLWLLAWGAVGAAASASDVSRSEVVRSIAVFQKEPASKEGFAAASVVMSFARESSAVHLALSKAVVPWLKGRDVSDADTRNILLSAYIAGNVEAQLKSGQARDEVYAGWRQVLATYAQLLHINSAAKIAEVDDLKSKETDGTLRAYADEMQAK